MGNQRNQCQGKRRHPTQKAAERDAEEYFIARDERMSAYRCEYCGYFHIGHVRTGRRWIADWDAIEDALLQQPDCNLSRFAGSLRDGSAHARFDALRSKFRARESSSGFSRF